MWGWSSTSSVCGAIHSHSSILSVSALRLNFTGFFNSFILSGKTWFVLAQNGKNGTDFTSYGILFFIRQIYAARSLSKFPPFFFSFP